MHQARDIERLKAELNATNASEVLRLESQANAEHHRLALAAKNEHDEQVRHAELKETNLKAETHNNMSADDVSKEQMRQEHHATVREMEA
eukprot:641675-Heterocapsa_arctica.AAC.1